MKLSSTLRSTSSMPFTWRTFVLAAAFFACLLLNTDYARGQTPPDDPPPDDDHADNPLYATQVPFGGSVEGRIDPAYDVDFFYFDISDQSGPVDVWVYTTGELDSFGWLYDKDLDLIARNDDSYIESRLRSFHVRAVLEPDYYFIAVRSFGRLFVGDYTLHVEPVVNPSNLMDSPTELDLDSPTPGRIDSRSETHFFELEFSEQTSLYLGAMNPAQQYRGGFFFAPLDATILDAEGSEVSVNIEPEFIRSPLGITRFGFLIEDDFDPGTYYLQLTTPADNFETTYPVFYTIDAFEDATYPGFIEFCTDRTQALDNSSIADPLYACQWHLDQPSGEDINVEPVWDQGITGEGINISVVDDGMDWRHEDLVDNVDASRNHDYSGKGDVYDPYAHHGTNVAGIIAARDNGVGVRGVAPRATIHGHNLLHETATSVFARVTDFDEADAMARNADVTAISNNSWGPASGAGPGGTSALWEFAVETGITSGNGGLGVLYVFAAGNGHLDGANANLNELGNFYAVTDVCAVNETGTRSIYSEIGANLWICAPSSGSSREGHRRTVTAENSDRYTYNFGGTSSAAPTVSGVAALVRQANPELTWRDVKLILAESARKNDPDNAGWIEGARTYRATSDSDRYHFNHEYGFGVVDAAAAVELAEAWDNLPPMREASIETAKIDRLIPDAYDAASIETVSLTLTLDLDTDLDFTEFVEINTSFQHNSFRDLDIELESPTGAISKIVPAFDTFIDDDDPDNDYIPLRDPFRFGSARHLGEDPNGTWTLRITDQFKVGTGILESWGITVYGHSSADVENVAPFFPDGETTTRSVAENTPSGAPVGVPVTADDIDALTYILGGTDMAHFDIDSATGQIAVGSATSLDFEVRTGYTATVTATDPSGASDTITVNIAVTDVSLGELGDRYDANHNERIDDAEVLQAVSDYFTGILTSDEILEVLSLYFSG